MQLYSSYMLEVYWVHLLNVQQDIYRPPAKQNLKYCTIHHTLLWLGYRQSETQLPIQIHPRSKSAASILSEPAVTSARDVETHVALGDPLYPSRARSCRERYPYCVRKEGEVWVVDLKRKEENRRRLALVGSEIEG